MRKALLSLMLLLFAPITATAQTTPAPRGPRVLPSPRVTRAPESTGAADPKLALPPAPAVSDPMLAPIPPPARVVSSWQEALDYLRARSTDLRVAVDQALQAEAQTRIALAAYLPTINGTVVATHNFFTKDNVPHAQVATGTATINGASGPVTVTIPPSSGITTTPTPDYVSTNIQMQQAIVNVAAFDQISINELSEDAARLSIDAEKRVLALSVANDIIAVVTAERLAEINRVGLRVALEQVEITTQKHSLGTATGLDVVRAQQNAANARATLVTGDETLREAREALGLALGVPGQTGITPSVHLDGIAADALASCQLLNDVDERPDVAQARKNLEVAKRNLRSVWFLFLPTLNAQSTIASTGQPVYSSLGTTWNIQAILSVPIWDGGARYGSFRSARAAEDIAAQNPISLRRQALVQVEQARRQLVVAETSSRIAKDQRDLAARNDQMTQAAYAAGQSTSLELVLASEQHRQAELNLAVQEFGVVKARIVAVLALATCPW